MRTFFLVFTYIDEGWRVDHIRGEIVDHDELWEASKHVSR
jgi:hypothetical protein